MNINQKIANMSKEERIQAVKNRVEGDHFRVTSGRGWRTVKVAKDGTHCYCTCPDKKFRGFKQKRLCKHEEALRRENPDRFYVENGLLYFAEPVMVGQAL